jgi:hypothetical protein
MMQELQCLIPIDPSFSEKFDELRLTDNAQEAFPSCAYFQYKM